MTAAPTPEPCGAGAPAEGLQFSVPFAALDAPPLLAWKVHGAENDFLFFQAHESHQPHRMPAPEALVRSQAWLGDADRWKGFVRNLCHRRTGVGADGLVIWSVSEASRDQRDEQTNSSPNNRPVAQTGTANVHMSIWNADGSRAATCGNALRCLGLLLRMGHAWDGIAPLPVFEDPNAVQKILQPRGQWSAQGMRPSEPLKPFATLRRTEQNPVANTGKAQVTVDMGWPSLLKSHTKIFQALQEALESASAAKGVHFCLEAAYQVELANPHIVLIARDRSECSTHKTLDSIESLLIDCGPDWKKLLLSITDGPVTADTNLGLLILSPDHHKPSSLAVHERGAGVTRACGSGATAAALAAQQHLDKAWKLNAPRPFTTPIHMPGGALTVSVEPDCAGPVAVMTGPAVAVAQVLIDPSKA